MKVMKMKKIMKKGIGMWKMTKQEAHGKKCIIVYIIILHDILVKFMWSPVGVQLESTELQVDSRWTPENLVVI